MNWFFCEKVTPLLTRIRDASGVCMYLIEGTERAALIDTGIGLGNLKDFVKTLTDKEPVVIVTHGHVDHAMGAGAFDTVYISPLDKEIYEAHSRLSERQAYLAGSGISGGHPEMAREAAASDWMPAKPWADFRALHVGDVFDLGGQELEICPGAGHTLGCVTVLWRQARILFPGDAANDFTFLFDLTGGGNVLKLRDYAASLRALDAVSAGRYDRCMFFHGPGEGSPNTVAAMIELTDDVRAGRDDALAFDGMGQRGLRLAKAIDFSRMCRADGKTGNLVYDEKLR